MSSPWYMQSYDTIRGPGIPANWLRAYFELCRAHVERAGEAVDGNRLFKADGTKTLPGQALTMEEAHLTRITGNNSYVLQNLERIQQRILSLANAADNGALVFYTKSLFDPEPVNQTWIESQIGFDLSVGPRKINDSNWWQAMQDAFDLLIYRNAINQPIKGYVNPDAIYFSGDLYSHDTPEDAWYARRSQEVGPGDPIPLPMWFPLWRLERGTISYPNPPLPPTIITRYRCYINEGGTVVFNQNRALDYLGSGLGTILTEGVAGATVGWGQYVFSARNDSIIPIAFVAGNTAAVYAPGEVGTKTVNWNGLEFSDAVADSYIPLGISTPETEEPPMGTDLDNLNTSDEVEINSVTANYTYDFRYRVTNYG